MNISHFTAKVLNRVQLLRHLNADAQIYINRKKFVVPLLGGQGYYNLNLSEPWMTNVLLNLRTLFNGHFVDVGVNLGQTLLKAHAVFDEMSYIGFEPNSSCINYVQELILCNRFKNALILPVAIGAKTEILKLNFFASDKSDSSATFIDNFKQNKKPDHSLFVPVFDFHLLSQFLPSKQFPILKIDVEGAEMEVLFGLSEWINSFYPIILLEILPVYNAGNSQRLDRQEKIEELMLKSDYKISRIKKGETVQLEFISEFGIHENLDNCDYLLYHSSLHDQILAAF